MELNDQSLEVINNPEKKRFEIKVGDHLAKAEYILTKTRIIFTHTEVPPALEGQGIGARLARFGLDYARQNQLQVMPLCPYIAAYIRKHPEYQDLLMKGIRI